MSEIIVRNELQIELQGERQFIVLNNVTAKGYDLEITDHGGYGDTFKVEIIETTIPPKIFAKTSGLCIFCGYTDDSVQSHKDSEVDLELAKKCIKIANELMCIESRYEAQHQMMDKLDVLKLGVQML